MRFSTFFAPLQGHCAKISNSKNDHFCSFSLVLSVLDLSRPLEGLLGPISWLVLDMGCLEGVRGSNGSAGAPVQPEIYKYLAKTSVLAHFCSFLLFLTSLGRQMAIMTHVLCSDMITKLFTVLTCSIAPMIRSR